MRHACLLDRDIAKIDQASTCSVDHVSNQFGMELDSGIRDQCIRAERSGRKCHTGASGHFACNFKQIDRSRLALGFLLCVEEHHHSPFGNSAVSGKSGLLEALLTAAMVRMPQNMRRIPQLTRIFTIVIFGFNANAIDRHGSWFFNALLLDILKDLTTDHLLSFSRRVLDILFQPKSFEFLVQQAADRKQIIELRVVDIRAKFFIAEIKQGNDDVALQYLTGAYNIGSCMVRCCFNAIQITKNILANLIIFINSEADRFISLVFKVTNNSVRHIIIVFPFYAQFKFGIFSGCLAILIVLKTQYTTNSRINAGLKCALLYITGGYFNG